MNGPLNNIPIPPPAQWGTGLDYEGELVVVIGKAAYNVPESSALEYVLGYTVGNDMCKYHPIDPSFSSREVERASERQVIKIFVITAVYCHSPSP